MSMFTDDAWALILAGGDGMRLRALTREITGEPRPKQFCELLDGETLLDRTRRRADRVARGDRQVVVVTESHAPFYRPLVGDLAPGRLVVQPSNRGTGPGLLYPLLQIGALAGDVPLAVFPSDHFVDDELAFAASVRTALEVSEARPGLVTLLGIEATSPETEYGWIDADGRPMPVAGPLVFPVRRFWEKPSREQALSLLARGGLWNSFVMAGRVSAFLDLFAARVPALLAAFEPVRRALGGSRESRVVERVYRGLATVSFSEAVLTPAAAHLGVVRVKGVEWSDLGNVQRLLATIRRAGCRPRWLDQIALPA